MSVVLMASLPLSVILMKETSVVQYLRNGSLLSIFSSVSLLTFPSVSSYSLEIGGGWLSNKYSFTLDFFSLSFFMLGYLVLWSILLFTLSYMSEEPGLKKFMIFMVVFMTFMFCLTSCTSLIFLLLGWESVSIMSFLLISWWPGRSEASTSALQAVIYNRVSDFSLYIAILMVVVYSSYQSFSFGGLNVLVGLGLLLSMVAKSAQFLFHPWLPNAMESPTPVSSLLHSSTMVMASVFLLIRTMECMPLVILSTVLLVSSLTMLYGSLCSLFQSDVKKTVAYSTTSQLGFMMATLSMGLPLVAFIHLALHAFFKSVIFMSSGYMIHDSANNQDYRRIGKNMVVSKIATISMTMGSFSLVSFPFFASFASKDLILENLMSSVLNRFCVVVVFFSCVLTVSYSSRLVLSSLKSVLSTSFLSKVNRSEYLGAISWNMNRSMMFIVSGSVLSYSMFMFLEEEMAAGSGIFSSVLISTSVLLGLVFVSASGQVSFYLFYFNPLVHSMTVRLVQGLVEKVGGTEFSLVESPFLTLENFKSLSVWVKKKYSFISYFLLISVCGLLLV